MRRNKKGSTRFTAGWEADTLFQDLFDGSVLYRRKN